MDQNHKVWNVQQQTLRQALSGSTDHSKAIGLFLSQHAMVHSAVMSGSGLWSFEDEVLSGLTDENIRQIPSVSEHSIAWMLWHITRIEDVTMNLLLSGSPQLLDQDGWYVRLGIPYRDTGNAMKVMSVAALSVGININALRAYRVAVGIRTREIVNNLQPLELRLKVEPSRLRRLLEEGAVVEDAHGLLDYWSGLTYAGLLLMPPTRHNFVHLNEAARLKQKIMKKSRNN